MSIGSYTYAITDPTVLLVTLDDDTSFPRVMDVHQAQFFTMQGPAANGLAPYFLELALADVTHAAFPSPTLNFNAFPSGDAQVPGFPYARSFIFYFGVRGALSQAYGGIQSMTIVPEPGAALLASVSLLPLTRRRTSSRSRAL